jgi:hypothetical protein
MRSLRRIELPITCWAYCDRSFNVDPQFEDWELELHEPPKQDLR